MGYGALGRYPEGHEQGASRPGRGRYLLSPPPPVPMRRRGLREKRRPAHGGRLRGEGPGPEPLCPLAGSWLPLVCKSAGRAKEASWCCGGLWKMKRW